MAFTYARFRCLSDCFDPVEEYSTLGVQDLYAQLKRTAREAEGASGFR